MFNSTAHQHKLACARHSAQSHMSDVQGTTLTLGFALTLDLWQGANKMWATLHNFLFFPLVGTLQQRYFSVRTTFRLYCVFLTQTSYDNDRGTKTLWVSQNKSDSVMRSCHGRSLSLLLNMHSRMMRLLCKRKLR